MYKFLIKASNTTKGLYKYLQEQVVVENEETGESVIKEKDYETDSLEEMSEKYEELLKSYTTSQIIPIHELETDLVTEIKEPEAKAEDEETEPTE